MTNEELELKSWRLRRRVLEAIKHAGAGHTGGSLSCTDILNVLYNRVLRVSPETFGDPKRDRYIQSKGHSVEALFVVLADRGFIADAELETLCRYKSHLVGHPTRKVPGIEQNTGALGHGLAVAAGIALAGKLDGDDYRVYALLGDGELAEGSNWEAAMFAAHHDLDNLTAIIDYNNLQITGRTKDVCDNSPIDEKFAAFGWEVRTVNGHDYAELTDAISSTSPGKPTAVVANTVKGRGVSFMENAVKWHHRVPTDEEFTQAIDEIDTKISALAGGRG